MARRTIRILCADDHEFLAEGLRTRIDIERDLEFAGWIGSAADLLQQVEQLRPQVVLLDIEMPGPDPFEVLRDLSRRFPDTRTIMLSAYIRDHYIDAALNAGAWGYLSKSDEPDTVIDAIRKVVDGEFAFGPKVLERCRPTKRGRGPKKPPMVKLQSLTEREIQILRLIGQGMSRTEIAETLNRSPKTVDNHRAAIMEKLGIHDRVELARFAIREGLTNA